MRAHGRRHHLGVLKHADGAFIPAEVHHGVRYLAVFDEENAVARQPGDLQGLGLQEADVPEAGDEERFLGGFDEIGESVILSFQEQVAR